MGTSKKAGAKAGAKKQNSKTTAAKEETPAKEGISKNTPAPAETQTSETPRPEAPAAPFEGGIEKELPKEELKVDEVITGKQEDLPNDRVLIGDEDLPKVDEVAINKEIMTQDTSPYNQDIEVVEEAKKTPEKTSGKQEWVDNPALLRKTEGFKDTLTGPMYKGVRKAK